MNRGEFAQFQKDREVIIEKNKPQALVVSKEDEQFNQQMQTLLASNSTAGISDSVGNFAKFLSTPINPMTSRPFYSGGVSASGANTAIDIAFGLLNILFRLFVR